MCVLVCISVLYMDYELGDAKQQITIIIINVENIARNHHQKSQRQQNIHECTCPMPVYDWPKIKKNI